MWYGEMIGNASLFVHDSNCGKKNLSGEAFTELNINGQEVEHKIKLKDVLNKDKSICNEKIATYLWNYLAANNPELLRGHIYTGIDIIRPRAIYLISKPGLKNFVFDTKIPPKPQKLSFKSYMWMREVGLNFENKKG